MPGVPVANPAADPQRFARLLRERGLLVPVDSTIRFTEALGILGAPGMPDLYWAARATLVVDHDDLAVFDSAFGDFFLRTAGEQPAGGPEPSPDDPELQGLDDSRIPEVPEGDADQEEPSEPVLVAWSRVETLLGRDLAACSAEELAELHPVVDSMRLRAPTVGSRRRRRNRIGRLDMARTVRRSLRSGSEFVNPRLAARSKSSRRMVLLVDVSGSMEPYARTLLRFAHAAVQSSRRVEVFAFATRLTRLTHELRSRDADEALAVATAAAPDISGGTRLGEALAEFNDRWGLRGAARGAVVVILSDGWDCGERGMVDTQMGRLARVAHRIVWVNPLKAGEGYEPLAAGMAEALPHIDHFTEGHSVASLAQLAGVVAGAATGARTTGTLAHR